MNFLYNRRFVANGIARIITSLALLLIYGNVSDYCVYLDQFYIVTKYDSYEMKPFSNLSCNFLVHTVYVDPLFEHACL